MSKLLSGFHTAPSIGKPSYAQFGKFVMCLFVEAQARAQNRRSAGWLQTSSRRANQASAT